MYETLFIGQMEYFITKSTKNNLDFLNDNGELKTNFKTTFDRSIVQRVTPFYTIESKLQVK